MVSLLICGWYLPYFVDEALCCYIVKENVSLCFFVDGREQKMNGSRSLSHLGKVMGKPAFYNVYILPLCVNTEDK